eukprot:6186825-Pleurochrysis_carterae.AAC.1
MVWNLFHPALTAVGLCDRLSDSWWDSVKHVNCATARSAAIRSGPLSPPLPLTMRCELSTLINAH